MKRYSRGGLHARRSSRHAQRGGVFEEPDFEDAFPANGPGATVASFLTLPEMVAFRGVSSVPRNSVTRVRVAGYVTVRNAEQLAQLVRAMPRAESVNIAFAVTGVEELAPLRLLRGLRNLRMPSVAPDVDTWPAMPATLVSLSQDAPPLTNAALQALPALREYGGQLSPDPSLDLGQLTSLDVRGTLVDERVVPLTPAHASTCRALDKLSGATEDFVQALPAATKARMTRLSFLKEHTVVDASTLTPFESLTFLSVHWLSGVTPDTELPPHLRTLALYADPSPLPWNASSPAEMADIINRCGVTTLQLDVHMTSDPRMQPLLEWTKHLHRAGAVMPLVTHLTGIPSSVLRDDAFLDRVHLVFPNVQLEAQLGGGGARTRRHRRGRGQTRRGRR